MSALASSSSAAATGHARSGTRIVCLCAACCAPRDPAQGGSDPAQGGRAGNGAGAKAGAAAAKPVLGLEQIVTQLTRNWGDGVAYRWPDRVIAYAINEQPQFGDSLNWTPMTERMAEYAAQAFELWDDLIAIDLEATTTQTPSIGFNSYLTPLNDGTYAELYINRLEGDRADLTYSNIVINATWRSLDEDTDFAPGQYGRLVYIHEIGHALGLSHPGLYNNIADYDENAEYFQDTLAYTVMSYFDAGENGEVVDHLDANGQLVYGQTPLLHDILTIQAVYGADLTTRTDDSVYGFGTVSGTRPDQDAFRFEVNRDPVIAIWDAGGQDWLDVSGFQSNQVIDLAQGGFSSVGALTRNVAIAFGTVIENAKGGGGADHIVGNAVANRLLGQAGDDRLMGLAGDDTLNGGTGADRMEGGLGDDTYFVDSLDDLVIEDRGGGRDTVRTTLRLPDGLVPDHVERVIYIGANLAPVAQNDALSVNAGSRLTANVLADNGAGRDLDPDGDPLRIVAVEGAAAGVGQAVKTARGARVTIAADGTLSYDQQGAFRDLARGQIAQDTLRYTVAAAGGEDEAVVTITVTGQALPNTAPIARDDVFRLRAGAAVEGSLFADNGAGADGDGEGDALSILAIDGVRRLVGMEAETPRGGEVLIARDGTVRYRASDRFQDLRRGERVVDELTYTVTDDQGGSDQAVVQFVVLGTADNRAPVARDDALTLATNGPVLTGNVLRDNGSGVDRDANGDRLSVVAVAGRADAVGRFVATEAGGRVLVAGDGTLRYDHRDRFLDLAQGETALDRFTYRIADGFGGSAQATVTITLTGAAAPLRVLTGDQGRDFFGFHQGPVRVLAAGGADTLHGGDWSDRLLGGSGNDLLAGHGGRDVLTGGAGADRFLFTRLGDGGDRISDFGTGDDRLLLERSTFTRLGATAEGRLLPGQFQDVTLDFADGRDRLLYDADTGMLRYDADGAGNRFRPVTVARLDPQTPLTADDIWLI